jgi:uncharacterized protein (TIGR00255 family)
MARTFRGKWEVGVTWEEFDGTENIQVNIAQAQKYLKACKILQKKLSVKNDLTLSFIARLPEIISVKTVSVISETTRNILYQALDESSAMLQASKEEEGKRLQEDISSRLEIVSKLIEKIAQQAPQVLEEYHQKLQERVNRFTGGLSEDENRLAMEVALLAERSDITEELTRLNAHCRNFQDCLKRSEPVGRELDFILQEILREINTVGAKSANTEISQLVIRIKTEVEKIREQIQNIE